MTLPIGWLSRAHGGGQEGVRRGSGGGQDSPRLVVASLYNVRKPSRESRRVEACGRLSSTTL
eukprot:9196821-Pyramimonas_sp.AAC.1